MQGGQGFTGKQLLERLFMKPKATERSVSEQLRQAGIPGIRYLDQGSRGAGTGTRNYVVFDDKLIDIIKKYGIAGLGAFPAGSHFLEQVDHDPFVKGKAAGGRVAKLSHKAVGYIQRGGRLEGEPDQGVGGKAHRANMPPLKGARKAKDGHWYVSDHRRPGKYLRVIA